MLFRRHKNTAMVPLMLLMKPTRSDELWDSCYQMSAAHAGFSRIYPAHPCWLLHSCRLRALQSTYPTNSRESQQLPRRAACAGWSLPTAPLWIRADRLAMSRAHASGRTWGPTSDAISMQWYFWYSSKSFSLHKFSTDPILGISPSFVVKREKKIFLLRYIEN